MPDPFRGPPGTNPPRYPKPAAGPPSQANWIAGGVIVAIILGLLFWATDPNRIVATGNPPAATATRAPPPAADSTTGQSLPRIPAFPEDASAGR